MKDKIAVVTGGTKGIGFSIAENLLKKGAKVFVCARDKFDLKRALEKLSAHGQVDGEVCDVRSEAQVKMMLDECVRIFGGVDILINNAGVGFIGQTVEEMSPDDFRQTLETNLFGVFYTCHHAIPLMKKRGGGYIINISSLAGQNAHPRMAAYNASKFGLNGFTEALMQEVRQDDIKVSYICPGFGQHGIRRRRSFRRKRLAITARRHCRNRLKFTRNESACLAEQGRDSPVKTAEKMI